MSDNKTPSFIYPFVIPADREEVLAAVKEFEDAPAPPPDQASLKRLGAVARGLRRFAARPDVRAAGCPPLSGVAGYTELLVTRGELPDQHGPPLWFLRWTWGQAADAVGELKAWVEDQRPAELRPHAARVLSALHVLPTRKPRESPPWTRKDVALAAGILPRQLVDVLPDLIGRGSVETTRGCDGGLSLPAERAEEAARLYASGLIDAPCDCPACRRAARRKKGSKPARRKR
jgi:hypothetical protein